MTELHEPSPVVRLKSGEESLVCWLVSGGASRLKEHQLDVLYSKGRKINLVPREIVEEEAALSIWLCFFQKF